MKHLLLIFTLFATLTVSAQRVIENPVIGARGAGACTGFFIDKIELSDNATKLFITYYHGHKNGWMRMASTTSLRSGDKRWTLLNAEGIALDTEVYPKDDGEFVTHFVLNFPAIDKNLQKVDFIELDAPNGFNLYDIALTDQAAAEIKKRNTMPDDIKNYAKNTKDNGESLDKNGFSMQDAIVKGKLYGFDKRFFGGTANPEITVYIFNPFTAEQDNYHATVATDGSYEIHVPMTSKYQVVYLSMTPIIHGQIMLSAGKTVVADFDFCQIYRPWELPANKLLPYFSGENVDINFALSNDLIDGFYRLYINGSVDVQKRYVNYSSEEFQDYILNAFDSFCSGVIDKSPFTKRAKELLKISAKSEAAYLLSQYPSLVQRAYRQINGKTGREPIPEFTMPEYDEQYLDYHKLLGLDDDMMFYANAFAYNISGWEMCFFHVYRKFRIYNNYYNFIADIWVNLPTKVKMTKAEKKIAPVYAKKFRERDTAFTAEEKAFRNKYREEADHQEDIAIAEKEKIADLNFIRLLGEGDCYFKDFIKLQEYCKPLNRQTVVPDSIVAEIEKMRFPFYAEYVKARNARLLAQIEAEKQRGGYYLHTVSDSEGDSLLEEILKDYKGKVVFIDFWNTWCSPCRSAIQQMKPMKRTLDGKDVEFVYIASTSSPENEYAGMIPSMHGHHYRLSERQYESLLRKWNFTGIPSYVIIGKDGMVKDFHTGFQHVDYYKQKINEELEKNTGKCYITGVLSDKLNDKTVIVCPTDVDIRTSNNYIKVTANEHGIFTCEVDADKISMYKVFLHEEYQRGIWHEGNFLVENNATVSLKYDGDRWKVVSGGKEQTLKNNIDAEAEQLFLVPSLNMDNNSIEKQQLYNKYTAWKRDNYKNRPILYNLYEIAENLRGANDNREEAQLEIYHTYFENFRTDDPIHNTIKMLEAAYKLQTGKPYIDFEVSTVDGKKINIEPLYRGKVTLIDFWASWCKPCRKHSIDLIPIYEKYKDKGFNVIAIAHEDKLSDMTHAATQDGYPWQSYIDLNDQLKVWQKNGLGFSGGGMYLIDSNGIILSTSTDMEELEPLIRKALGM